MKMNIKDTLHNYVRILSIAKKATRKDYSDTVRICGLGIAIIGTIGFFFYLISVMVGGL